jgi:fructose-1,6-bisphosphatase/inositol monophosphatase family enzyme
MVSNPATGEIAYAAEGGPTRIVQLSAFGEEASAQTLPLTRLDAASVLINVHPGRAAGPLLSRLYEAWAGGDVRMVRSPGGSPAWALLEAAKGSFVYVNLWSSRPAAAFDLAAACLLVRGSGGDVVDLDGKSINSVSHAGPFVAAVDAESRSMVADLVSRVGERTSSERLGNEGNQTHQDHES